MKPLKILPLMVSLLFGIQYVVNAQQESECPPASFLPNQPIQVSISQQTASLYSEPSLESNTLASLQWGEIIRVAGETSCVEGELWYPVRANELQGWLMFGSPTDPQLIPVNRFALLVRPANDPVGSILVRDTDGHTLLERHIFASELSWSPGGQDLVFSGHVPDLPGQHPLFRLNIQQDMITPLSTAGAWYDNFPVWSPDGQKIVYTSRQDNLAMWIINADGSSETKLVGDGSFFSQYNWSPDSQQIAFVKKLSDQNTDVMMVNADGSNETTLSGEPGYEQHPVWSPDGTQIAYDDGTNIILVNVPDLERQTLTTGSTPAWSPDGKQLLFQWENDIFAIDLASNTETQLTNTPSVEMNASWSPDGAWIAYVAQDQDGYYLHIESRDGSQMFIEGPVMSGDPNFAGYVWLR